MFFPEKYFILVLKKIFFFLVIETILMFYDVFVSIWSNLNSTKIKVGSCKKKIYQKNCYLYFGV